MYYYLLGAQEVLEHTYVVLEEQRSPSPPPLPPPFITDSMDDLLGTTPGDESGYRNISAYQRSKVMAPTPVNRQSTAAELAYLYQREDYYINHNSPRAIQSHQNNPPTTYQQASASQIDQKNHYDFPTSLSLVEFHKQL